MLRVAGKADVVEMERVDKELSTGTGALLLVEDGDKVRTLAKQILEESGYTVVEASNGVETLAACNEGINVNLIY